MTQITINSGFYYVTVTDAFTTAYVCQWNKLHALPENAELFMHDEAVEKIEELQELYPECKIEMEMDTEEVEIDTFYEEVADKLNQARWDYDHSERSQEASRFGELNADMLNEYGFNNEDVQAVNNLIDFETPMTIKEHAESLADSIAQKITGNKYQTLTFSIKF